MNQVKVDDVFFSTEYPKVLRHLLKRYCMIGVGWIKCRQLDPCKVCAENVPVQKKTDTDFANICSIFASIKNYALE